MNFNFDTGLIDTIQTLDCSQLPPLGGTAGVLTLIGTGALILTQGSTAQRPTPDNVSAPAFAGAFRYNTTGSALEYFDGLNWQTLSYAAGAVSSFNTTLSGLTPSTATTGAVTLAGTLGVASGGTGAVTLTSNGVVFGNGTSPVGVTAGGATYNVLTVDGSGVPVFGQVDLSQSAAVVNALSLTNGGTNASLTASNGGIVYSTASALAISSVGAVGQVLTSTGAGAPTWTTASSTITTNQIVQGDGAGAFTANAGTFVGSPTFSGVTLQGTVTNATDAVTKAYVDAATSGLKIHASCDLLADTTNTFLASAVYADGSVGYPGAGNGVGATLTDSTAGSVLVIDGATPILGDRILVNAYANGSASANFNGFYTLTTVGVAGTTKWVLTRATDYDNHLLDQVGPGSFSFVYDGTKYASTGWVQIDKGTGYAGSEPDSIVIHSGVTGNNIFFSQFSGAGTYTAGAGLDLTGTTFSARVDSTTVHIDGGNNIAVLSSSTVDQVLLSQGAGNTAAWGALPLNNTNAVTGTLNISNGGTGLSTTPTNGQLLIGNGTGYSLTAITAGTGVSVTNGSGTITIANTGVTSFQTSLNGLTPSTSTTGAVTLAGTLGTSSGGTGASLTNVPGAVVYGGASAMAYSAAGTAGYILESGGTGAPTWVNPATNFVTSLTAGSGISLSAATGAITVSNTGVLDVSLNDTSTTPIYTVSPTASTTGSVGLTIALNNQNANLVFAGPTTGSPAQPTFRALVAADMPTNAGLQLYAENPSSPTAPSATGTNSVAIGSGASATATNSFAVGTGSKASIYGSDVFSNGSFATAGDAQGGFYILRNITSNATPTELFLDGVAGTQRLVFPNNSVVTFDILVAGRRTDAVGGGAGYRFVGVIRKDTTAGSNTFVGAVSKTVIGETDVSWDANCTASTINGNLVVTVTGQAAKTIRWVATVRTTEVTN